MIDIQFRRPDGSFVATVNGMPYHVTAAEPELYALALQTGMSAPFEPAPPTPTAEETLAAWRATAEVSRFQAFAALYSIGKLDDARAAVDAAGGLAVIAWENAQVFRRNSPMILQLAPALGLDDVDLDDLFLTAAQITA